MNVHAYPAVHSQASTPLIPSSALTNLSNYLSASQSTPWLHPDAMLSTGGIQYSTNGGPQGGIVMHNLRRVEKGLKGEILAPEPDQLFGEGKIFDDAGESARGNKGAKFPLKSALKRRASEIVEDEGQDPVEYAQQQEVLEGDVGDRDGAPVVAQGEDEDRLRIRHYEDDEDGSKKPLTEREKKARKLEKKNRVKERQRQKEQAKAG